MTALLMVGFPEISRASDKLFEEPLVQNIPTPATGFFPILKQAALT